LLAASGGLDRRWERWARGRISADGGTLIPKINETAFGYVMRVDDDGCGDRLRVPDRAVGFSDRA